MLAKTNYPTAILLLSTVIALLVGCTSSFKYPGHPVVTPGTKIQVNLSAKFPEDGSMVYIQNGKISSKESKDRYQTYCTLSLKPGASVAAEQWQVLPGEFTVTKIRLYNDYVHNPVIYASTDLDFYHPGGGVNYRTELYLKSANQPIVRDLSCTNYNPDYSRRGFYPVKSEFVKALGDLIEF